MKTALFYAAAMMGIIALLLMLLTLAGVIFIELPSYYAWLHLSAKAAILLGVLSIIALWKMSNDTEPDDTYYH